MKKLAYTPFSIVFGMLGARVGKKAFAAIWGSVSDAPKPSPKQPEASLGRLAASAALEGATLAAAGAVAKQLSVRAFHHLFGVWPVKPKPPKHADAA
jgi:hypothetical protein